MKNQPVTSKSIELSTLICTKFTPVQIYDMSHIQFHIFILYGHVANPQWPLPYWHDSSFGRTRAEEESPIELLALEERPDREFSRISFGKIKFRKIWQTGS